MIAPLAKAIRDTLRVKLKPHNIDEDSIKVTKDRKVDADSGQVAISIYSVDLSPDDHSGNAILVVNSTIAVGFTLRGRFVPVDRRGENLVTDIGDASIISLDELIQITVRSIHGQPSIVQKASLIAENLGVVYCEPLYLARSISTPEDVGQDHFNIPPDADSGVEYNEDDLEGIYQEVVFQGGKCFQPALDFKPNIEEE